MKPLNLTDDERNNMHITYDMNKYCMYCKGETGLWFVSSYLSKEDLKEDMKLNNIKPVFDHGAAMKYLEQVGAFA